jgi:hypothetical protein
MCQLPHCGTVNTAGRREEKSQSRQHLTPSEENTLADYILRMAERGYPALSSCSDIWRG